MTFFTKELGLISALCKSGRTPKKQALLQAFTALWINLNTKNGYHYVNKIELQAASLNLSGDSLLASWYLNEIIQHALRLEDPSDAIYLMYENSLLLLSNAKTKLEIEKILRKFEFILLQELGYAISWTHDAQSQQPICKENFYTFNAEYGFIQTTTPNISGADILSIANHMFEDPKVLNSAKMIMRKALHHALDGVCLHTRNLYIV